MDENESSEIEQASQVTPLRLVSVKHLVWVDLVNSVPVWMLRNDKIREAINLAFNMGVAARDIAFDADLQTKDEFRNRAKYERESIMEGWE